MDIIVNKKTIEVPKDCTIDALLQHIKSSKSVAVFVNERQLLMAEYDQYRLNENDMVKIIKPLGGG